MLYTAVIIAAINYSQVARFLDKNREVKLHIAIAVACGADHRVDNLCPVIISYTIIDIKLILIHYVRKNNNNIMF